MSLTEGELLLKVKENIHLPKRRLPFQFDDEGKIRKVLRQEHKFFITGAQFRHYENFISHLLKKDNHGGFDGYMVRSLYFDTLGDYDYFTKMDGIDLRKKIRIRIYNTKSDYALLEMKQKQSSFQLKRSIKIKRDDAQELCRGIYTPLLFYDDPFALECYTLMKTRGYVPKVIVQYKRLAYVANGNETRITFDRELMATESCFDIFTQKLCLYPVADPFNIVLEVKYNGFLFSYIKDLIQEIDKSAITASKYCMARTATLDYRS